MDEKTKQVQVRLTPELHSKLKGTLAFEERKLVDFFNEAALAYLTDQAKYEKCISEIIGGCNYGKGKKAGSIVRQPINKSFPCLNLLLLHIQKKRHMLFS